MDDDHYHEPETAAEHFLAGKEDQPGKAKLSAEANTSASFDWESVFEHLDGAFEGVANPERQRMATALMKFLEWINEPARHYVISRKPRAIPGLVGLRAIASLYVLRPDAFDGKSMAQLSRGLGLHRAGISARASEFTARWGIVTHAQSHGRNGLHREPTTPVDKPITPPL